MALLRADIEISELADKMMVFLGRVVVTKKVIRASCRDEQVHRAQTVG